MLVMPMSQKLDRLSRFLELGFDREDNLHYKQQLTLQINQPLIAIQRKQINDLKQKMQRLTQLKKLATETASSGVPTTVHLQQLFTLFEQYSALVSDFLDYDDSLLQERKQWQKTINKMHERYDNVLLLDDRSPPTYVVFYALLNNPFLVLSDAQKARVAAMPILDFCLELSRHAKTDFQAAMCFSFVEDLYLGEMASDYFFHQYVKATLDSFKTSLNQAVDAAQSCLDQWRKKYEDICEGSDTTIAKNAIHMLIDDVKSQLEDISELYCKRSFVVFVDLSCRNRCLDVYQSLLTFASDLLNNTLVDADIRHDLAALLERNGNVLKVDAMTDETVKAKMRKQSKEIDSMLCSCADNNERAWAIMLFAPKNQRADRLSALPDFNANAPLEMPMYPDLARTNLASRSLLHVAMYHSDKASIELLVKSYDADVLCVDADGYSPWQLIDKQSILIRESLRGLFSSAVTNRHRLVGSGVRQCDAVADGYEECKGVEAAIASIGLT